MCSASGAQPSPLHRLVVADVHGVGAAAVLTTLLGSSRLRRFIFEPSSARCICAPLRRGHGRRVSRPGLPLAAAPATICRTGHRPAALCGARWRKGLLRRVDRDPGTDHPV
jgi:hypothetical protein